MHPTLRYCFGEGRLSQKKTQHLQWPQAPLEELNLWSAHYRTCETGGHLNYVWFEPTTLPGAPEAPGVPPECNLRVSNALKLAHTY